MKKILILTILLLFMFSFSASAAIGSKGLILEGGKEQLVLKKGEKRYINVRDGFTKLPRFKSISYFSDNTVVATIGLHSGILRANSIGSATITAISNDGHAGRIHVKIVSSKMNAFWFLIPILILIIGYFFLKH